MKTVTEIRYAITLPDGSRIGNMTRREALDTLPWMPCGSEITPPIPKDASEAGRCLLDYLANQTRT
jgi:hypothetical protein